MNFADTADKKWRNLENWRQRLWTMLMVQTEQTRCQVYITAHLLTSLFAVNNVEQCQLFIFQIFQIIYFANINNYVSIFQTQQTRSRRKWRNLENWRQRLWTILMVQTEWKRRQAMWRVTTNRIQVVQLRLQQMDIPGKFC